eukprot:TRINITY_DN24455_c0_g1_i2.p1 TRINITY_DN24455_c0_g1~~TRINITY_DN24455_c0_g1_i2.p1  ORF type:complete len:140 (-),score=2.84 TRINITY_DN24455_c0_g1_i2:279-668(-)
MVRRPPRSTHCISSAASDVYKRQIRYLLLAESPIYDLHPSSKKKCSINSGRHPECYCSSLCSSILNCLLLSFSHLLVSPRNAAGFVLSRFIATTRGCCSFTMLLSAVSLHVISIGEDTGMSWHAEGTMS